MTNRINREMIDGMCFRLKENTGLKLKVVHQNGYYNLFEEHGPGYDTIRAGMSASEIYDSLVVANRVIESMRLNKNKEVTAQ
jgi:hypothetical protein